MIIVLDFLRLGPRRFHELSLRAKVVLSQLPLNVTMLYVCVISMLSDPADFADEGFIASQLLALGILSICAVTPWERLPRWSTLAIPILDFYAIGLLRFSDADLVEGLGLLAVFPVTWLAGSGYRPRLAVAFGTIATLLMVWVPHFMDGSTDVHTLAPELLTPFIVLGLGIATSVMTVSSEAQRQQISEVLHRSETRRRLLNTILDTVDVGVVVLDADGNDLLMNARQRELHAAALPSGAADAHEADLLIYQDGAERLVPPPDRPARRAIAGETFSHEVYRLGRGPKARDTFVAAMSHEFRTPLTSLIGYAELLQDDPSLSAAARSDTRIMARNARHLNKMIDDILAAATPGSTDMQRVPLDLVRLVREQAASAAPEATSRNIQLDLAAEGELTVLGDRTAVVRLLDNLVSNALKYSPDGTTIRLSAGREGTWALVAVEDQGIGIAPEDIDRVFKRFQRSSAAVRAGVPGTGLGLALAQEVAEDHGGTLEVTSNLGAGSVFTLRLPLHESS